MTCRKRKTRCAGERPTCSTCTKNGHLCLGYTEIIDRKKELGGASDERGGTSDPGNDPEDDFLEDEEDEDRRHWKAKNGVKPRPFGGSESPSSRDSGSSTTATSLA